MEQVSQVIERDDVAEGGEVKEMTLSTYFSP